MKPLLYAGALLMVGASIYGFVDYKKTSRDTRFKTLYQETKAEEPPILVNEKRETHEIVSTKKEMRKNDPSGTGKRIKQKRAKKLNSKIYSRAALESYEPVEAETSTVINEVKVEK